MCAVLRLSSVSLEGVATRASVFFETESLQWCFVCVPCSAFVRLLSRSPACSCEFIIQTSPTSDTAFASLPVRPPPPAIHHHCKTLSQFTRCASPVATFSAASLPQSLHITDQLNNIFIVEAK